MGNCLVLQGDFDRVMETDSEIMLQKSRFKVDELLFEFSHETSDDCQVAKHMHPSHSHYMLHQPESPRPIKMAAANNKQKVRFSDKEGGVVRMKLVISKKELQEILSKGEVSVGDLILTVKNQEMANKAEYRDDGMTSKGRFPALASIPELD